MKKKKFLKTSRAGKQDFCRDHQAPKNFSCTDCKYWVCGTCLAFDHRQCHTLYVGEVLYVGKKEMYQRTAEAKQILIERMETDERKKPMLNTKKEKLKAELTLLKQALAERTKELKEKQDLMKEFEDY